MIPSQRHPNDLDVGGIEGSAWMSLIGKNQSHSFRYNRIPETDEGQPLRHGTNCLRFDMLTVAETAVLIEIWHHWFHRSSESTISLTFFRRMKSKVHQLPVFSLGMLVAFLVASVRRFIRSFLVGILVAVQHLCVLLVVKGNLRLRGAANTPRYSNYITIINYRNIRYPPVN